MAEAAADTGAGAAAEATEAGESKVVHFHVGMTCGGCSGAVTRILNRIEGVENVAADVEAKTVDVTCAQEVDEQAMLEALKKWGNAAGKEVELLES